jgi:type III secretion system FlhB-like substrate exporter
VILPFVPASETPSLRATQQCLSKLDLDQEPETHRRVAAVLAFLKEMSDDTAAPGR